MHPEIWAEVRRLSEVDHLSKSEIARRMGIDRKTVRRALKTNTFTQKRNSSSLPSKLDPFKPYLVDRLQAYPRLAATVLYEEIKQRGYTGKLRILSAKVGEIRKTQTEVYVRWETLPGEYAQVDWANCGTLPIGNAIRKLSCFVMVFSYSRMLFLQFTLSQCLEDFIQCHLAAFQFFGGIPKKILYDNLKTVVLSRVGKSIQFNPKFMVFAGTYRFEPIPCNPGRGNEKGKVESGIKYIRGSFLAGRTPTSWPALQGEAERWRDEVANTRIHGTTRERPIHRWQREQSLLLPLPEREYDARIIRTVQPTSQALVHFDGNVYSVPYTLAHQALTLKATPHEVHLFQEAQAVATHRRSYERGVVVEDPKHFEGILRTKRKAAVTHQQDRFLALGEQAKVYLEGLLQSELNVAHHIEKILTWVDQYGKVEVLQAMDRASAFKAFGAPYLQNMILQQRVARGLPEPIPIVVPTKPAWTTLAVEETDLSLYDDLFEQEETHEPTR